ncbi:MAG: hypothetical protein AAFW69_04630 [Pseudomonadota bacterium]
MSAGTRSAGAELMLLVLIVAAGIGALIYFSGPPETPLRQSAMGHDGLVTWLRSEGIEARSFVGGGRLGRDNTGLVILPLYDTDLRSPAPEPETREAYIATATEVDMPLQVLRQKERSLDLLVVLPKWRRAARLSGLAHPDLRALGPDAARPLAQMRIYARLVRPEAGLARFAADIPDAPLLEAAIYAPQLFIGWPESCESWIGDARGSLLLVCDDRERPRALLSDPDLLNNHGLGLGDNAVIAAALARALAGPEAGAGPVVVDLTTRAFTGPVQMRQDRSLAELSRVLGPPFIALWIGAAVLLALAVWRSSIRTGPALRPFEDGMRAAKAVSVAAKARLLRMTGADRDLLALHVESRATGALARLYGARPGGRDPVAALARRTARRDPEAAEALLAAAAAARAPGEDALAPRLHAFEDAMESLTDGSGRTTERR